jgi:ferritin-like metal-binding protein YciE
VIDTAMARLGGQVMRRPVYEVEQEITAAQDAQRKAEREARSQQRKARLEKNNQHTHAKVEELKSRLERIDASAAA